jgi:hypothetical protein
VGNWANDPDQWGLPNKLIRLQESSVGSRQPRGPCCQLQMTPYVLRRSPVVAEACLRQAILVVIRCRVVEFVLTRPRAFKAAVASGLKPYL